MNYFVLNIKEFILKKNFGIISSLQLYWDEILLIVLIRITGIVQ